MQTFARAIFSVVLLTGVFVASAKADTLYTYVGDTFTTVTGVYSRGDQVTGSLVLSGLYVPDTSGVGIKTVTNFITSYSFTDGSQTLTQANSRLGIFQVGFNPNGTPIVPTDASNVNADWCLAIFGASGEILTEDFGGDYQTFASNGNSTEKILSFDKSGQPGGPGTWSVQAPEGGTTALFLLVGLAGLTILRRIKGLKHVTSGL